MSTSRSGTAWGKYGYGTLTHLFDVQQDLPQRGGVQRFERQRVGVLAVVAHRGWVDAKG